MTKFLNYISVTPNFFVIGAAKSGTTTLYHVIKQHPEVFLSKIKEPHFFDNDRNYERGHDWYISEYFRGSERFPARGEATPSYLSLGEKVAPRIARLRGKQQTKFIAILRDPVERAYSSYNDRRRMGRERDTFEDALNIEESRIQSNDYHWGDYFKHGLYSMQLRIYEEVFGRNSLLILRFEELMRDYIGVSKMVFSFLDLDQNVVIGADVNRNMASAPRSIWYHNAVTRPGLWKTIVRSVLPREMVRRLKIHALKLNLQPMPNARMPALLEQKLRARYSEEFDRLETMLGWDLSSWRKGPQG